MWRAQGRAAPRGVSAPWPCSKEVRSTSYAMVGERDFAGARRAPPPEMVWCGRGRAAGDNGAPGAKQAGDGVDRKARAAAQPLPFPTCKKP